VPEPTGPKLQRLKRLWYRVIIDNDFDVDFKPEKKKL